MRTLLDGGFRFDTFVIGGSNRLAVSAARGSLETPELATAAGPRSGSAAT